MISKSFRNFNFKYFSFSISALIFLVLIFGRIGTSLFYPGNLNPDEMQMGANALRIFNYGINLNSIDGTSSGILNSLVLCWPLIFDLNITYVSIRLSALVLIALVTFFTFKILKELSNYYLAIIFILPLVLFYSFTKDPDFLHYSSELLSTTLILLSLYFFIYQFYQKKNKDKCSLKITFFILFFLGSIPYAKVQFILPSLVIAALYLTFIYFYKLSAKHYFAFLIGGLFTSIILITPLYFQNNLKDFFISYILWSFEFASQSQNEFSGPISEVKKTLDSSNSFAIRTTSNFIYHLKHNSVFHLIYFYFIISIYFLSFIFFKKKIFSNHIIIFLLFVIFSILLSILIPGRLHRHYLHSFLPIIVIFTGTLGGIYFLELKEKLKKTFIYFFIFIYFCGTLLLSISLLSESKSIYAVKGYDKNINFKSVNLKSPNIFKYLNLNTQSNLFVWGWMPHLYILSHLTPATQETITEKQIIYSANQNYYLKRVIKDLNFSKPDLIIDTVNGKSFRFDINSIEKNIMNFTDLKNYIQNNYKLIKGYKNNPECAKNYISNNKYNLLKKNLIRFSSIESKKVKLSYNKSYDILDFRAANLDDFSVTEDTCFDYWLLPDGEVGQVSLLFQKEELVKKVLILNTKNSNITDRSTNEIEIKLLQKKKLKKKNKIKLQSYPYWTEIILDKPIKADEITVEILSFYGNGAGLNEIKVFRAF